MTTTHKTMTALRVVKDSMEEFQVVPKLEPQIVPKPVVGLGRPEEVRYQGMPDKPRAYKARWDVYHPTCP
jgi:hypothetical protein